MSRARAFTLMEVLLALSLVLLLSGAVYGFLWNLLGQRDRVAQAAEEAGTATAIIERVEADLLGSLAEAAGKPGIEGTTSSLRMMSRGVAVPVDAAERAGALGDLHGTEIRFDRASGAVRGRRWAAAGAEGEFEEVGRGVQRLRFRYFEGRRWASEFDSASEGRLPAAVEVAIWFGPLLERPETTAEAERAGAGGEERMTEGEPPATPDREPDRVRVMVVPDGPSAAWREGR